MPFMYKLYAEFQKFDHFWAPKQLLIRDDGRILGSEHWAAVIAKPDRWGNLQYKHSTCMLCVDRCVQTAYLSAPKKTCIPTRCQRSYGKYWQHNMHSLHFFYVKRNVYSLNIGVFSCLCQLMVHDDAVYMSYQAREVTSDPVTALTCSDVRPTAGTSFLLPLRPHALGSLGCYNVCQIF